MSVVQQALIIHHLTGKVKNESPLRLVSRHFSPPGKKGTVYTNDVSIHCSPSLVKCFYRKDSWLLVSPVSPSARASHDKSDQYSYDATAGTEQGDPTTAHGRSAIMRRNFR